MPSQLEKSRLAAFHRQGGLCYYCNLPVWLDDAGGFRARYPMSSQQLKLRRCTAEHLVAQQDGGCDHADNIVAACWLCNCRRHRRRRAHSPVEHRRYVQRLVRQGRWLPRATLSALQSARPHQDQ